MAKPIEIIEKNENHNKISGIVPEGYMKNFQNLLDTIKVLDESGILVFIKALSKNYRDIFDILSEKLDQDSVKKSSGNLLSVFGLLNEIDPDKTYELMSKLGNAINTTNLPQDAKKIGLLGSIKLLDEPDINIMIRYTIDILHKVLSKEK